jgi:hypothetical protein
MKIREVTAPPPSSTIGAPPPPAVEAEPTQKDVADIQALLGTIDPVKEQPQTLLNKLNGWMKQYPILDKVTDIIPQTRLIKAIAAAADAIEAGDNKTALNALAGAVGGGIAQAARAVNVGTALAQGDVKSAALSAGGNVANLAKGASAVNTLAQGGTAVQAAQDLGGTAAKLAKGAEFVQNKLAPANEPDDVARVRKLSGLG